MWGGREDELPCLSLAARSESGRQVSSSSWASGVGGPGHKIWRVALDYSTRPRPRGPRCSTHPTCLLCSPARWAPCLSLPSSPFVLSPCPALSSEASCLSFSWMQGRTFLLEAWGPGRGRQGWDAGRLSWRALAALPLATRLSLAVGAVSTLQAPSLLAIPGAAPEGRPRIILRAQSGPNCQPGRRCSPQLGRQATPGGPGVAPAEARSPEGWGRAEHLGGWAGTCPRAHSRSSRFHAHPTDHVTGISWQFCPWGLESEWRV